ncbi:MAG: lamin tail domain-containing protein, partial [Thermoguttaceae bacterium]
MLTKPPGTRSPGMREGGLAFETLEKRVLLDGSPIISEFMAINDTTRADEDGIYSDWLEIHNPAATPVDITGWKLRDGGNEWTFPSMSLAAGEFRTLFASGKNRIDPAGELHTNFSLKGGGEYLGLLDETGVVIHEYNEYPDQTADISYGIGQDIDATMFVSAGDAAKYLIPSSDPGAWTTVGFGDGGWSTGDTGIGFADTVPGFAVRNYKASVQVLDLSIALDVIADPSKQSSVHSENRDVVNYWNSGGHGHYLDEVDFPGAIGLEDDFAVEATGFVTIPTAGPWSFGVNSDDGFGLDLTNGIDSYHMEYPGLRGNNDTIATFNLPAAGTYNLRLVAFERGGGASVEAFAAQGTYASFDAGAFDLIGDTANGGLAIVSEPFSGSSATTEFVRLIDTDVEDVMWDVNASMFVRMPFTLTAEDLSQLESLRLSMQYDDGFVAYLNGTEIARSNAPPSPTYSSSATAERTENQAVAREDIDVSAYLGALVVGENVLAIQAMNYAADDKDFLVLPELGQILYLGAGEHYFAVATPGAPNAEEYWLQVEDTKFSVDRGFYDAPINVQITTATEDAEIYYTLDSSEPSATNGTLYVAGSPISINRTTALRARAFKAALVPTDIDTQTYIFLDDVVAQSPAGEPPGAGWPTGNVNGQMINYGMDPDIVGGYNTIDEVKTSLLSIPTISMVTDLDNLFGATSGIIVNANMDGRGWERPASIELIYPEGATGPGFPDGADGGFQVNAGVRIRGGYSRQDSNPKHAFRLFFRDEYGDSRLQYSLFGDEGADEFRKVDLRTSQNYSWAFGGPNNNTMVRELYSREVQGALGHQYTRGRFYHLYIDGQYWGVFQTDEREEANFAETYYGGDNDDYDVIKPADNRRVYATDGNLEAYNRLWDATANIGYADTVNYYRVQGMNTDGSPNPAYERLLDVDNVIDYMIITYYTGDRDGPGSWYTMGGSGPNNFFAIYNRENPDGFKFFEHDSEHSLGTGENNMVLRNGQLLEEWSPVAYLQDRFAPHWLHEQLVDNPDYVQRFSDRMYEVFYNGGQFDYPNSLARVNDIAARVDQAMIAESARWGDTKTNPPKNHADWVGDVNEIRNWIVGRSDTVVNQVKVVGWYPSTAAATYYVNASAQHGGSIRFGDVLTITAPAGTIYYTLDGTDPADGGSVYSGPIVMNDSTHVRTRVFNGGEWSPLSKTTFYIDIASDIRITELMYNPADPTPAEIAAGHTNNDDFEYIEIKNLSTTESLPLMNLRLTDAIIYTFSPPSSPTVWIGPGEFIVLAKDPAAFNFRYDTFVGTVVGPYDAGSLNNAGEMLQLDSPVGGIIHQFIYNDNWYGHTDGDGFSLTIRDPGGDAALWDSKDGWRASAAIGGTPGYEDTAVDPGSVIINEVLAHSDTPFVDTIELYNTTGATIDISGWFLSDRKTDDLGVETLTKYQLPGGSVIAGGGYLVLYENQHFGVAFALSEHGDDVYLSSNAAGAAGGYREHVDFGASPTNVSFGLYTKSTGGTDFTLLSDRSFGLVNDPPYLEDLVINEVMYHPAAPSVDEIAAGFADDDSFEFVEIYNKSTTTSYTLSDYYLSNGAGFTFGWYDADTAGNESRTLEAGATATWNASLPAGAADYEVFARWDLLDALGNQRDLDGQAAYAITHNGGTATVIRDQKPELLDEGPDYIDAEGWVSLGTYSLDGNGQVVLTRGTNNAGNWTIADQVKFVRTGYSDVIVDNPTLDSRYTADGPATIGPGEYVVLVSDYDAFGQRYDIAAGGIPVVGVYTGRLNNGGEKVKLMRAGDPEVSGYLPYYRIDYVNYNDVVPWPLEADGRGSALNRIDTAAYGNDPINWAASTQFGTPGAANISIDRTAPSVPGNLGGYTTIAPNTVSLTWNASNDAETFVDHYRIYRDGDLLATSPT